MNPKYSVTAYLVAVLLVILMTDDCLRARWGRNKEPDAPPGGGMYLKRARLFVYPLFVLLAFLPIAGTFLPDSRVKFALMAAGNIWLGFAIYFGGTLLLLWLLFQVCCLVQRRRSRTLAGLVIGLSLLVGVATLVYGLVHARNTKVKTYSVSIGEESGDHTYRIVLLADLHLSVNSSRSMIRRMVDLANAQEPDAIVIAGDIFTSTYAGLKDPDAYSALLRTLQAEDGVYMVAGNHDVEETLFCGFPVSPISQAFRTPEMAQFFEDCGFTVLDDALVELAGGDLLLAGRLDGEKAGDGTKARKSAAQLLADVPADVPVIVLEHEPVEFAQLQEAGADLALCGHTHNGQIFPGNYFTRFFNSNPHGLRTVDGLQTLVTAGVGFYGPPMRVGTDSEVTVVDITY